MVADAGPEAELRERLARLLLKDPWRRRVLELLRDVSPDVWVIGGFVRNSIWDDIAGHPAPAELEDVDVVLFAPGTSADDVECAIAARLTTGLPGVPWSVRNQARMHARSGDGPYPNLATAIAFFPDTASAVAVRLNQDGTLSVLAPYGLADAFAGLVRPTPQARGRQPDRYARVVARKAVQWKRRWPCLQIESPDG